MKRQITLRIDEPTVDCFLRDCAAQRQKLA